MTAKQYFFIFQVLKEEGPSEDPLLFDVHLDPSESCDVSADHPEVIDQIGAVVAGIKKLWSQQKTN